MPIYRTLIAAFARIVPKVIELSFSCLLNDDRNFKRRRSF